LAKQLLGEEGDEVDTRLPSGTKTFDILEVKYQEIIFETH
jgi:transcription elongation factor GreA